MYRKISNRSSTRLVLRKCEKLYRKGRRENGNIHDIIESVLMHGKLHRRVMKRCVYFLSRVVVSKIGIVIINKICKGCPKGQGSCKVISILPSGYFERAIVSFELSTCCVKFVFLAARYLRNFYSINRP